MTIPVKFGVVVRGPVNKKVSLNEKAELNGVSCTYICMTMNKSFFHKENGPKICPLKGVSDDNSVPSFCCLKTFYRSATLAFSRAGRGSSSDYGSESSSTNPTHYNLQLQP
jgi:hypothetical protein